MSTTSQDPERAPAGRPPRRPRRLSWIVVLGSLGAAFTGYITNREAFDGFVFRSASTLGPVAGLIGGDPAGTVETYYASLARHDYKAAAAMLAGDAREGRDADSLRENAVVYANADFRFEPDGSSGTTVQVAPTTLLLRSARTGCARAEQLVTVKKTGGRWLFGGSWKIVSIPTQRWPGGHKCSRDDVEVSWKRASADDPGITEATPTLAPWARRRLQRVDPLLDRTGREVTGDFAAGTQSRNWSPRNLFDYEDSAKGAKAGKPRQTAWKSRTVAIGSEGIVLEIELPRRIRVARLRFHNGTGTGPEFWNVGRAERLTLWTRDGTHQAVAHATLDHNTDNQLTLDCDLGTASHVFVRVDSAGGDDPQVALRDLQIWGVASNRYVAPPLAEQNAEPFTGQDDGPGSSYCTAP